MRTGLPVALLGIADQADQAIADVVHAAGVVEDALAGRVVVQRIDGEVAALGVVLERAIDVVAKDASALVARGQLAGILVVFFRVVGAEGGDFDDLAAEVHVDELEAPADHACVAKLGTDLFRGRTGGDVVILGIELQQQIAHTATHDIGLVAGLLQALDHAHRMTADLVAMQECCRLDRISGVRRGCGMRRSGRRKDWNSFSA